MLNAKLPAEAAHEDEPTCYIKCTPKEYIKHNTFVDANGCWIWRKSLKMGYGVATVNGDTRPAHRHAWRAFVGAIPEGMQLNHKCHVRACVNPEHMYIGDQIQNMADMRAAGRRVILRGEDSGMSKLSDEQIRQIRASELPTRALCNMYGVSMSLVYAIKKRQIWKHVDAE